MPHRSREHFSPTTAVDVDEFDRLDSAMLGVPDDESPRRLEFILRNEILALILTQGVDGSGFSPLVHSSMPKEHPASEAEMLSSAPETSMEIYASPDGAVSLPVRFDGGTAWATQVQMAELFGTTRRKAGLHLENSYDERELDGSTSKDFLQVRREGSRDVTRSILHYDLDAMPSVGYRVHSPLGVHFRRWATTGSHRGCDESHSA